MLLIFYQQSTGYECYVTGKLDPETILPQSFDLRVSFDVSFLLVCRVNDLMGSVQYFQPVIVV